MFHVFMFVAIISMERMAMHPKRLASISDNCGLNAFFSSD